MEVSIDGIVAGCERWCTANWSSKLMGFEKILLSYIDNISPAGAVLYIYVPMVGLSFVRMLARWRANLASAGLQSRTSLTCKGW